MCVLGCVRGILCACLGACTIFLRVSTWLCTWGFFNVCTRVCACDLTRVPGCVTRPSPQPLPEVVAVTPRCHHPPAPSSLEPEPGVGAIRPRNRRDAGGLGMPGSAGAPARAEAGRCRSGPRWYRGSPGGLWLRRLSTPSGSWQGRVPGRTALSLHAMTPALGVGHVRAEKLGDHRDSAGERGVWGGGGVPGCLPPRSILRWGPLFGRAGLRGRIPLSQLGNILF